MSPVDEWKASGTPDMKSSAFAGDERSKPMFMIYRPEGMLRIIERRCPPEYSSTVLLASFLSCSSAFSISATTSAEFLTEMLRK